MRRVSTILSILLLAYFQINTIAQTGPGGIGNSDGSNGQPTNILWLRADDLGLSDGASVSAWPDSSGNGNDLGSSVNDPNDPTFYLNQINSLPIVRFSSASGNGTKLIKNPFTGFAASEITTIIVYQTNDSNDGLVSYATSGDNNNFLLYNSSNLTSYIAGGNLASSYDLRSASFQIMVHKWRNSNGELHLIQNSTDVYNTTGFRTGSTITDGGSLSIGGEQDAVDGSYVASQAFDGDIAEIIMFSSYLNDAQRIIIENYLQIKYGIGISTNDHFSLGDVSYINDFTGVGQEADGNHLESSSAGFYITADVGTLDNSEYLMFAHSSTANAVSTNDLPTGVEARWARDWYVEKTGNLNATLTFDLPEGISGQYPQNISNYVLLYRNATTGNYAQVTATVNYGDADQVAFSVTDANLTSGYYTLGTTDQTNSPVEGAPGTTWYTLASGDWNNSDIWTLDPSGALPNNPSGLYPQSPSDKVVIKSGKNVNMNLNNIHCSLLQVDGRLDLNTSTGHTFDVIKGNGRILMAADNFPSFTDMSDFNTAGQGEGTVVYYGSADYSLSTPYTFYNMEVNMSTGNTVTLLTDYTVNGYLRVLNGTFKINDNSATTNLNLTVKGNVTVESTASITTGTANARHQFNFYGDLTNNGTIKFTNRTTADYANEATDGIVDANFLNSSKDQSILCNGTTDFYRIEIDKGTDATYILSIEATGTANFNLFGYAAENHPDVVQLTDNNNALGLVKGTVKISSNVNIPALTTVGNYNISEAAKLWVAGGSVAVTGNAIVPYGELYVSSGLFESLVTHGIALRKNGILRVSGGTVNTNIIRTASSSAATNRGSYVQTGGTVNIINPGNATTDYYHFCLTYPEVTFYMSGGTLHVYDANGNAASEGGIFIASSSDNINVSGGTVIAEINSVTDTFKINSTAPFYNLIFRNTLNSTTDFKLANASGVGPLNIDQSPQALVVLNDLTIEDNCFLDHNGQDITIGGGFSIAENTQLDDIGSGNNYGLLYDATKPNTLTFNGSGSDTLYIGHNIDDVYELYVWNLTVNKESGSEIVLKGDPNKDPTLTTVSPEWHNRLLNVQGTIDVINGTLNQGHQSIRLYANVYVRSTGILGVYEQGVTPLTAYIMLKDDNTGSTDLNTEKGAQLGNLKLNPGASRSVGILSDVYIKRVAFYSGSMNLRTYNLKVDYLHRNATLNNYRKTDGSTSEMIYSDANASDGGLSILITGNGTYCFPLGTRTTTTRYTYAEMVVTNFVDSGYVTIRPVDGELKTTNLSGGDLLDYYWRVGYTGFTTLPTVQYEFKYDLSDDINGTDDTFYPGKVLDVDPYTRSYENDLTKVDDDSEGATYTITFNDTGSGFTLEKANYTAGVANRFTGTVAQFHSNATYQNWDVAGTWLENQVPTTGSVVYIRNRNRVWGNNIPNIPAVVIFERTSTDDPTSETVPRLQFNTSGTFDIGRVEGTGMISLNTNANPTVVADWGEFAKNDTAIFMYWGSTGGVTLNNIPQPLPSLMLESDVFTIDQNIIVNADLIFNGNANATFVQDITIRRDLVTGFWRGGTFHFPGTGNAITITVERNIDYTQYNDQGYSRNIIVDDPGSASSLEHKLIVKGDIIQGSKDNYTLDLFNASNRPAVILELQGSGSNKYYRTSTVVPDFYRIVMNKGSSQVDTFSFNNNFTLNGPTSGVGVSKALELQNGTLVLNDPNININLTTGDDNFSIPASAGLEVRQGQVNANGNSGILLDGKLFVNGGTVDMSGGDNFIQYSASGNAVLEVAGGTLKVGSQVRRSTSSTEGILTYKQTGGIVEIGTDAAGQNSRGIFEITNTGSSFEYTGGTYTLVNDYRTNPTIASFYFNPETVNIASGQEITFGNANTVASAKDFTIYAGKDLMNLTTDNSSANSPTLTMQVVPLTLTENLNIGSGTTVDANGLDINMYGNFNNSGTFTANQNAVYFLADTTQSINGTTTFYDLYKTTGTDTLKLGTSSDITVEHYLSFESGLFQDNGNNVNVKGNLNNVVTTLSSGAGNGIVLNGTSEQTITGSGTYARLMMDNAAGATVPTGNNITVTDSLLLKQGIFDIGKNLLILTKDADIVETAPFSESNMISTNISFTDAGVKKYFPIITDTTVFTYPMGSAGKYTPVTFEITANGNDTASIRIRAANERHPSIIEDSEAPNPEIPDTANVLWYYWTIDANGIAGFSATAIMDCYASDVKVTSPYTSADYITARLLDANLGTWDKFDKLDFNESTNELYFYYTGTNDQGIDGDYTAGIDDAIPDQVPSYITIANGDWSDASIWDTYPTSGGSVPAGGPRGSIVYIQHTVTTPANFVSAYITRMLATGILNLGTTFGHRLGFVSGTGKIYLETGDLPAGVYDDFFAADSGTIEYGGANAIDILSEITAVNNLILSGTNDRVFPNLDLVIRGNLTINGPDVKNTHNESVEVRKDITFTSGTFDAGFDDGSDVNNGMFIIGGNTTQHIYGPATFTGTNAFNHFKMNNPIGIVLDQPIDIDNQLVFVSGPITTTSTNILKLNSTGENIVTGAGAGNYVDGPILKNINTNGSFNFPTGNAGRYGNVLISSTTTTGNQYWEVQYYNHNPGNDGYDPTVYASPLQTVSDNEYWRIKSPVSTTALIQLRWDSQSGMPTDAANYTKTRIAEWRNTVPQWEEVDPNNTFSGAGSTGTVSSTVASNFNEWAGIGNLFSLSTTYVSQDFTWDGSASVVWNDTANWNVSLVPTALDSVIIASGMPNDPTISISAECGGMDLQAGATLTINSGASLTLSGDLVMNGDILLKSDANGTGVLIDNGNIGGTGTATVERFLSGSKYHYISAPLSAIPHTTYYAQLPGETQVNTNYYWYDETNSNSNWLYGWVAQNGTGNMTIARGYAYYYTKDYTFVQTGGNFNTGNLSISVTNTGNGVGSDGWNLIGNPYPSTILADEFIYNNNSVIDGTLYFWDDPGTNGSYTSSDYATWNLAGAVGTGTGTASNSITPDGYIGVGQSFFVHTNAGGTVNFSNSMRRIGNGQFFKEAVYDGVGRLKLSLSNDATKMYNELLIAFTNGASDDFDNLYDGEKLKGNPDIAFYSKLKDKDYAIQSFAPLNAYDEKQVPLGFELSQSGDYQIKVQQFENLNNDVQIILKDNLLDSLINLRENNTYTFSTTAGTNDNRFEVLFNYLPANDGVVNHSPVLFIPLADALATEDLNFEYKVATNTFKDADIQDTLSYKATLIDGSALPAWLSFNSNTLTFAGTPENKDVGLITVQLTATDLAGESTYDVFVLQVLNVNDAPEIINYIPDQSINAGEEYSYTVPQNTFIDVDEGDSIQLSAKLADGSNLPDWLNFDEQTGKLYGTAAGSGDIRISIIATDKAGASTGDEFTLSVKSITGINSLSESKVNIYPNPTSGKFVIETNYYSDDLDIIIRDNQGKIIKQMKPQSKNTHVDITNFASGLYFIELKENDKSIVHKINLNK
jgi:hypothetical protein